MHSMTYAAASFCNSLRSTGHEIRRLAIGLALDDEEAGRRSHEQINVTSRATVGKANQAPGGDHGRRRLDVQPPFEVQDEAVSMLTCIPFLASLQDACEKVPEQQDIN